METSNPLAVIFVRRPIMSRLEKSLPEREKVTFDEHGLSAYLRVLEAEEAALLTAKRNAPKYNDDLIGARVIGFLLYDFWTHQHNSLGSAPYIRIRQEIASCGEVKGQVEYEKIYKLGLLYRNYLIRVFRSNTGPLPTDFQHPSCPSMERVRQRIILEMQTPSARSDVRKHLLLRDGYRCVLTGAYDTTSCLEYPALTGLAHEHAEAGELGTSFTQVAHIFSEYAQTNDKTVDYVSGVLAQLEMFGLKDTVQALVGGNINNPFNTLTMASELHFYFDRLDFWLEEVPGQVNTYDVKSVHEWFFDDKGFPTPPHRRVTFTVDPSVVATCVANNRPVPALPSPVLLGIRAACSRVVHMSGAIGKILRAPVLAEDGTARDLLASRTLQLL